MPTSLSPAERIAGPIFRRLARIGAFLVPAVFLLSACGNGDAPANPAGMAMPVSVVTVKAQSVPNIIEVVGQSEGALEVEVRARVSGILMKQLYKEGETVRAGAVLFQIDPAPYEIALSQAQAALAQAKARAEQATREAARLKTLIDEKAISQREYDDATSTLKASDAALLAAQAQVREAQLNLSYTAVTAPIAGTTGRAQRSVGSLITVGADSLLTTLSLTDPIWIRFSLSETEYLKLRHANGNTGVQLVLPNGETYSAPGRLNFSASTVDPKLGTVQLRAEFANPDLVILPGQFVRTRVIAGSDQAFLVPQVAVMQSDQGRFVWVAGPDGKAMPKPVDAGAWVGHDWAIRSGLADGDRVIVDNLIKLRPGVPVAPQAPGAMPGAPANPKGNASGGAAGKSPNGKPAQPRTDQPA